MSPRVDSFKSICSDPAYWKDDDATCDSTTIDTVTCQMSCVKLNDGSTSSRSKSKLFRFAPEDEIQLIRHIDDFSDEEIAAIWFDQQYYANIKTEYKNVVFAMERGRHVEGDEQTSRGLEHRTEEGSWARFQTKRDSYNAVLDEQDRQWKEDSDDHDKISQIYITHSHKCARKAYQMGLMDEIAARKVYAEAMSSSPLIKTYNSPSKRATGLLQAASPSARKNSIQTSRMSSPTSVISART
jgi:hypothetical protein